MTDYDDEFDRRDVDEEIEVGPTAPPFLPPSTEMRATLTFSYGGVSRVLHMQLEALETAPEHLDILRYDVYPITTIAGRTRVYVSGFLLGPEGPDMSDPLIFGASAVASERKCS